MLFLSPLLLFLLLVPKENASAEVVGSDFEIDYETAKNLAGLAIECHDQVRRRFLTSVIPESSP